MPWDREEFQGSRRWLVQDHDLSGWGWEEVGDGFLNAFFDDIVHRLRALENKVALHRPFDENKWVFA